MNKLTALAQDITQQLNRHTHTLVIEQGEITIEVPSVSLIPTCLILRDESELQFEMLLDVCGVDYLEYGHSEWRTQSSTSVGFDRGVSRLHEENQWDKPRFAVIYHLLSLKHNHRLRVRVFAGEADQTSAGLPILDSVVSIWPSANWYEREVFDLYGLVFKGHPDLRRILTDYGFNGYPFRKDFPLIGHVEVNYDAAKKQVVNTPVTSVTARTLVPKVIRSTDK